MPTRKFSSIDDIQIRPNSIGVITDTWIG